MKIDRELFYSKISKAVKFVPDAAAIPAFEDFLIEASGDKIKITATNGSVQMETSCNADIVEPVKFCVPARIFVKTIALLRENEVTLIIKDQKTMEVKSGKSKYKITMSTFPEHFPVMKIENSTSEMTMHQKSVKQAIKQAVKFCEEDSNKGTHGVRFFFQDGKMIVNGARQYYMCRNIVRPISIVKWDPITIPNDTAEKIAGVMDDNGEFTMIHNSGKVSVFNDPSSPESFVITATLSSLAYPNTEMIFAKTRPEKIVLNTLEFKDAVKRLALYSSKGIQPQFNMITVGKEVKLTSEDVDSIRDGEEMIDVFNPEDSPVIEKSFNSEYMIDVLTSIETELIELHYNSSNSDPEYILPVNDEATEKTIDFIICEVKPITKK